MDCRGDRIDDGVYLLLLEHGAGVLQPDDNGGAGLSLVAGKDILPGNREQHGGVRDVAVLPYGIGKLLLPGELHPLRLQALAHAEAGVLEDELVAGVDLLAHYAVALQGKDDVVVVVALHVNGIGALLDLVLELVRVKRVQSLDELGRGELPQRAHVRALGPDHEIDNDGKADGERQDDYDLAHHVVRFEEAQE